METSNQSHFSLSNIPPELWASIVRFLPGEQLGRLKMTGSKHLWYRLRTTNVVKSVNLGKEILSFKSWPLFLQEFPSIEELVLEGQTVVCWLRAGLSLNMMPFTLRKLELRRCPFEQCAGTFFAEDSVPLNLDEHMPHLEVLNLIGLELPTGTWMRRIPTTVTDLSLFGWDGEEQLPPKLIRLKLRIGINMYPSGARPQLPCELQILIISEMPYGSTRNELILVLPASIRQLRIRNDDDMRYSLDKLPPSLTSLHDLVLDEVESLHSPEAIKHLPQTLTELKAMFTMSSKCWKYLPPSLTKLRFPSSPALCATSPKSITDPKTGRTHIFGTYPLEILPRSITDLEIFQLKATNAMYMDALFETLGPMFPPHLTTLDVKSFQLSPAAASHLPRSISHLKTFYLCEDVCKHLPGRLLRLEVENVFMSANLVKLLPKYLKSLVLRYASRSWYNHYGEVSSPSDHPLFAIHQNYGSDVDWKGHYTLPSTIMELELYQFSDLGDSFGYQHLPNLGKLDLTNSMNFTDLTIPHLSRHLSHLNLHSAGKITGQCFHHLPGGLTYLNLNSSSLIYDSDIQHLPRTLEEIHFYSASNLTNSCIPDFPRNLKTLHLESNMKITKACFNDLPAPIRSSFGYRRFAVKFWSVKNGRPVYDVCSLI